MKSFRCLMAFFTLLLGWSGEEPPKLTSVVVPSAFQDGQILVKWSTPLKISQKKGVDFSIFTIMPDENMPAWRLSIYDGNHPQPLAPNPDRKREWWPLSRLSNLLIHRSNDGSLSGECYVPAGRQWDINEKNGTFTWTGPERRIHVMMWFVNEAAVDSTLTSLEITWIKIPTP